jgi:hypothetical protein
VIKQLKFYWVCLNKSGASRISAFQATKRGYPAGVVALSRKGQSHPLAGISGMRLYMNSVEMVTITNRGDGYQMHEKNKNW